MSITSEQLEELHPLEVKVLLGIKEDAKFTTEDIVKEIKLVLGQANQTVSWLLGKAIIKEIKREQKTIFELTELGQDWLLHGSPIQRFFREAKEKLEDETQSIPLDSVFQALSEIPPAVLGAAFGLLSKEGVFVMDKEKNISLDKKYKKQEPQTVVCLKYLLENEGDIKHKDAKEIKTHTEVLEKFSKRKGTSQVPFRKIDRETITHAFTKKGIEWIQAVKKSGLTGQEINALTSEMLKNNTWQDKNFRAYNVVSPPNRVSVGQENAYANFLRQAKDKLTSMGFEEFDGPLVETEFWNSDALFMPQFHAARDIHDVYYIEEPQHAKKIDEPYLSQVAQEHEEGKFSGSRGWQYGFDKDFTRRLILRSQGTVMSAKTLPTAKAPGKYFGMLRVFRHDQVDATHLSDFYQTEGIVLGDDVNVETLLGLLKVFAEEFTHAEEIKYVPGYFPFTEPSIEVHVKHPDIGWIELGGSGIFRPEVTKPLGIDVPVAAWGIGIDRMATMQMNIKDIRELFSYDLKQNALQKKVKL